MSSSAVPPPSAGAIPSTCGEACLAPNTSATLILSYGIATPVSVAVLLAARVVVGVIGITDSAIVASRVEVLAPAHDEMSRASKECTISCSAPKIDTINSKIDDLLPLTRGSV